MRRLTMRLLALGILSIFGWISYQLADFTKCSGPRAEAWALQTLHRLEQASKDMQSVSPSSPVTVFPPLSRKAKARYLEQQGQNTPSCLSSLQEKTLEDLYYEWKAYEAATKSDFEAASSYMYKAADAQEAMEQDFYKLANKYGWDIDP